MTRRRQTRRTAPSAVWAIFDPAGAIHVRAIAPSGNTYEIAPRASFLVADKDVDWLFHEWNSEHRQCLSRVEEYQPRRVQFENGEASRLAGAAVVTASESAVERPQFENGEASRLATAVAVVTAPEPSVEPELMVEPEPVVEPEESTEPDPAVEADESENGNV